MASLRRMHNDVPLQNRQFAKAMRGNATEAERRLWSLLRAGRFEGHKFKRQVPLDGYILDFVCFEAKLIIEADGSQHLESVHDEIRDRHFEAAGYGRCDCGTVIYSAAPRASRR